VRFRASDVAAATRGRLVGPDTDIVGAAFDARTLCPGELFVPLVAARDGHEFIPQAIAAKAAAYLTSRPAEPTGIPAVEVADTADALLALAGWARTRLAAVDVVGITGSVGKTSTKDLIAAALAVERRVTANERSFNNEQGMPVTILGAADDTDVLVLEMGMRGIGEIARLAAVARPGVGVVTSVAPAHTERVGGIEGVARAKGELVDALPADGTAVLNADDALVAAMARRTTATVVTFGWTDRADVRIADLRLDALARPRFAVRSPWGDVEVALRVSGAHMAANAAAALAVAGMLGVDIVAAGAALATARLSAMRMELVPTAAGGVVINDAYNANPTSMRAALDTLARMDASRRIAVLGLMAELDDPAGAHREIAEQAGRLGIELVAVGTDLYGPAPLAPERVPEALGTLGKGVAVLVKASRAAALEAVAEDLIRAH
jgi:UDP-N-acetylmuramoyl-tripeptide--D-alanyl-D-alanine ligase